MIIVPEAEIANLMDREQSFVAVEAVFAAMARGDAYNFPVIREAIGHADALYGFKSGFDRNNLALGLKSGGYWPGNMAKGLTNHQSSVILFDADTGKVKALVGGNLLTALRTGGGLGCVNQISCAAKCAGVGHDRGGPPVGISNAGGG